MHKKLLRFLSSVLSAVLLCGCTTAPAVQTMTASASSAASVQAAAAGTLKIPCTAAGFNPYITADTLARQNAGLLFEKLVEITPDLDLDYRLAQSIDNNGTAVVLQIRSGCYFADGTEITAADAAASLAAAMASEAYGARLANIASVTVAGSAVCLTLQKPDSLFAYLLDVPVLKAGETAAVQPTASGRYTYGADGATLEKNPRAAFADGGPDTIQLVTISNADSLVSGLAMGTINYYAPADSGSTAAGINTVESSYKTNDLLFVGVNAAASNPLCATPAGRCLLSALADRNDLAARCYASRAYAATGALNSFYPCVKGRQSILSSADTSSLDAVMTSLGYKMDSASGFYTNGRSHAHVSLLVCSASSSKRYAAAVLAQEWQSAGIEAEITEISTYAEYLQTIQSGQFELYIGETKLYNDIDLSPFWTGSASAGVQPSEALTAAYAAFCANAGTAGEFETAFAAEMPYIPLLWCNGVIVTGRRVSGVSASASSAFYSLSSLAVSGS